MLTLLVGLVLAATASSVVLTRGACSPDQQAETPTVHSSPRSTESARTATSAAVSTTARQTGGNPSIQADPLEGTTIAIDPGHNGGNFTHAAEIGRLVDAGTLTKPCDTTGTATNDGYTEAAYNLDVARRLAILLRNAGARVLLTRRTNRGWGPCITERAAVGNQAGADVAISIHADGGPPGGRGFHVIYPPPIKGFTDDIASASHKLALDVRRDFHADTAMPYANYVGLDGLDVRSDLGGLNLSDVPKVLIETGNMRNAVDAKLLSDSGFRQDEAEGLARGLERFLSRAAR